MIIVRPERGIKQGNSITLHAFFVVLNILVDTHFMENVSNLVLT